MLAATTGSDRRPTEAAIGAAHRPAGGTILPAGWRMARQYPVAALTAIGLLIGLFLLPLHAGSARIVLATVAIGGGIPLVLGTLQNMLRGRFHVDMIAALAIVGSVALGEFLAGALVVLMQSGGEALEDYGLRRANRSLDNLLRRAPSVAHRRSGAEFIDVPAGALQIADIILIRPGDIIAADGIVVEGEGSVDEAALTGEPVPLAKRPGDRVFSGTINLTGSFQVRTTSTAAESKYERIVRMVQQAQGERAPINRLANQYTPYFTLLTLAISAGVLLAVHNPVRALAVLVVATPCPLIIATPLAVLSAINRAASLNIILKSGAAIEQAGEVDTVLFDKTGTLTLGEPTLTEIRCFDADPHLARHPDRLLQGVASVELHSSHVLAGAVVRAARERGLSLSPAADVIEMPGTGVTGKVGERCWIIGSGSYVRSQGVEVPQELGSERVRLGQATKTVAYVAVDGRLIGLLTFADPIRPEAPAMLRRLRELKVTRTVMLTGDAPETARAVASQVGIDEVRARLQPEEKLAAIRAFSNTGRVMMVGDGINDAPALAAAHVGVAMGGYGAGIATDAADVVITVENVERVADTIALGRRMVTVARQGILLGIGVSVLLMILASLGYIPPALGAVFQEVLDLATILNALRAR
jgi:heavy metal translocating P-type ATPase